MLRTNSTPRKGPPPSSSDTRAKRKSVSASPARRRVGVAVSPRKIARPGTNSGADATPTKSEFALADLDAVLSHYFSPKRKASKSPARAAAKRTLNFDADVEVNEADESTDDENNDENVAPSTQPPPPPNEVKCDLEELVHCFAGIDAYLPEEQAKLEASYYAEFSYWTRILQTNKFSLLLHGLGSKRSLLREYAKRSLSTHHYIEFQCYRPGVNCRQIFEAISAEFELKVARRTMSLREWAVRLREAVESSAKSIFLLMHNIDAQCMRDSTQQQALSILAESKCVHLIASVDHINATLLWDLKTRERFNWLLVPVPTYRTHGDVLAGCELKSLGLNAKQGGRQHTFASLDVFWQATTQNMRKILQQLAIHAGTSATNKGIAGDEVEALTISKFCRVLKQEFATTSEAVLRQQLGEFVDSSIVRMDKEGSILLTVDRNLLVAFLESKNF